MDETKLLLKQFVASGHTMHLMGSTTTPALTVGNHLLEPVAVIVRTIQPQELDIITALKKQVSDLSLQVEDLMFPDGRYPDG